MKFGVLFIGMAILLSSHHSQACPAGAVTLNDDTVLTADGIYDLSDKKTLTIGELKKDQGADIRLEITDSNGKTTHRVIVLGTFEDQGGIIQTTYLLKDAQDKETLMVLKSNYRGNGERSRGFEAPESQAQKDAVFSSLYVAGCH